MANFNTHLTIGGIASGMMATGAVAAKITGHPDGMICFLLGTLASLLPDLDSDYSTVLKGFFSVSGIGVSFQSAIALTNKYALAPWQGVLVFGLAFGFLFTVPLQVFRRLTVHRGIFHSIPAGVMFALITVSVSFQALGMGYYRGWLYGSFIFFGYLVHLVLDEIYSIDAMGMRVKASFGTALKIYDRQKPVSTGIVYALILVECLMVPDPIPFFVVTIQKLGMGL